MQKTLLKFLLLTGLLNLVFFYASAQTPAPGTATFQYQAGLNQEVASTAYCVYVPTISQDAGTGYQFISQATGAAAGGPYNQVGFYTYATNDAMLAYNRSAAGVTITTAYLGSATTGEASSNTATSLPAFGGNFQISSIDFEAASGSPTISIQAYRGGVAIGSPVTQAITSTSKTTVNLSANSNFYNINEIAITGFAGDGIRVDNITSAAAITTVAPTVTTTTPSAITATSATVGGNITSIGSASITSYGVVYSTTNTTPTTADTKDQIGTTGTFPGTYSASLTGLTANTTYYLRAYAINSAGTSYGAVSTFTTLPLPTVFYTSPQVYTTNVAISSLTPTTTNSPTSYSISAMLPAGLNFSTSTGVISGTPTAASPATNYTVTATNANGSGMAIINITVNAQPAISYSTPQTYYVGSAITTLSPVNTGGAIGSYGAAANFGSVNGADDAIIDASGNLYTYSTSANTISAFNSAGTAITNAYTSASVTYSNVQAAVFDGAYNMYVSNYGSNTVTRITPAGVVTNITVNTPLGLTADASNNIYVASGNGTVYKIASGATTATSFLTGFSSPYGIAINSAGDIYVGQTSDNTIYKIANGSMTHVSFATGFSSPRSIVFDPSGNLTVSDAYNNVVKKITPGGVITTVVSSGLNTPTGEVFDASGNLYVTNYYLGTLEKYTATYYSISPTLPAGLTFNTYSGNITGTPTATATAANYTVTGYYGSGSTTTAVINITVVNPTAPMAANVANCGAGTVTLTASGSTPSGGTYNWYTAASGGTAVATGATYSPNVLVTTTYYVSYTSGSYTTSRTAVTATINPIVSSPLANQFFAYPFSAGSTNDISGNSNTGHLQFVSPSTVNATTSADRYGAANSAYTFDGKGQNLYTTTQIANPGPNTITLSLWFNTTTTSGGKLIGYEGTQTGGGQFDRHIYMDNGGLLYYGVYVSGTKTINSTTAYNDGKWHHVVVTMGPTNGAVMYVDDINVASNNTITSGEPHAGYWLVGGGELSGWPSTNGIASTFFAGQIDDVGVYSTEQTSAQITTSDNLNLIGTTATVVCAGSPISFTSQTITGATYTWTDPGGNTQIGQNPTFASAIAGAYSLAVTGGPGGCSSTATITPTINPQPSATFTAPSTVSVGNSATITFTGTYNSGYTYSWNFNGGTPATGTGQGPFSVSWSSTGTKTVTLTVTNPTTGCVAISNQTVTVGNFGTYGYSLPLTINPTGLGITTDQTNFPFLMTVTDLSLVITTNGCSNKVQYPAGNASGYYDMAFTVGGAEIPYQVESYNTSTGTLLVWVKLPTLSHNTNSAVTFYYGSATANSGNNYNNVWANVVASSGTSYKGVWHFNEAPSATTSTLIDATGNGNNLIASSLANVTQNSSSLIANGVTLNSGTVSKTGVTNFGSLALTSPITMSAWVYYTVTPSNNANPMVLQSASGYDQMEFRSPNNYIGLYSSGGPTVVAGTTVPALSAWHYLVYTYDGTNNNFYVDGALNATSITAPNAGTITNLFFGSYGVGAGEYFIGNMDESRVIGTPLTADWVKAEYNNQKNPASYTTVGTITTYFANASALNGGITYSTADGISFNYTINSATTTATPPTNGTANIVVTGTSAALSAALTIYQLTVNSSDQVDLNGQTMNVGCNVFNNGTITNSSSTAASLIFNGAASAQTYTAGSSSNTATVDNFTVNNSAAGTITVAGGPVNITNTLTMVKGNLTISATAGTAFTLKSTAAQTASIAQIPAGSVISGNAYVERYIAGGTNHRGYRLMSNPVNQGTNAAKVSGQPYYGFTDLQSTTIVTGYGATGAYSSSTQPVSAFDPSTNGNPSIFFYNEPSTDPINTAIVNSDYKGISTINEVLPIGNGYLFFFRGNRNVTDGSGHNKATTSAIPENTTFRFYGNLNQGSINVYIPSSAVQTVSGHSVYVTPSTAASTFTYTNHSSVNDGFQLVGNPYACAVDLDGITLNNPYNKFIYMLNDAGTMGVYQQGSGTAGTFTNTSSNPLTNNANNNGVGRYIVPGQGFFIRANTPTGTTSLTFPESSKVLNLPSYQTPTSFQFVKPKSFAFLDDAAKTNSAALTQKSAESQFVHIRLSLDSFNNNETVISFGTASAKNKFDGHEDAYYTYGLSQTTFMASYTSDTQPCIINSMGSIDSIKTIQLYAEGQISGLYKMEFAGFSSIDPRYKVYLKDNLLKDSLDLSANNVYNFNIDRTNSQTYGQNRFTLVFYPTNIANYYHLSNFSGLKQTGGNMLNWTTQYEGDYTGFVLQRSTDGFKTFIVLDSVQSNGSGVYSFLDTKPFLGVNQYRLVQNNINNVNSFSNIVTISYQPINAITSKFQIYPNPAVSVINFNVNIPNNTSTLFVKIYNSTGILMISDKLSTNNTLSQDVSKLIKGTYVIQLSDSNGKNYGTALFTKL